MAVYNGEKYLKQAVDSILAQTFTDFEFIIVNDGSTDRSREILESYNDDRVHLYNNENKGQTRSLNEAIKYASGKYIARTDADDISLPTRFEKQVAFLDSNPGCAMCGSFASIIDGDGHFVKEYVVPVSDVQIKRNILIHNPFIHPSVMMRKDVLDKVGVYDESFSCSQDYELWTRIVFKYKTANIPEALVDYRVHGVQMTNNYKLKMQMEGIKCRVLGLWRAIRRKCNLFTRVT